MRASAKPVSRPSRNGVLAASAGRIGSNTLIAACRRPNSASSLNGKLMCMLCRFDQPCPWQPKMRSYARYTASLPCGHRCVSRSGFIHGCAPPGISRAFHGSSIELMRCTAARKSPTTASRRGRGPFVFTSITCSASSLLHAISPCSVSSVSSPAASVSRRSAKGATSSVVRSTIMYSISMPNLEKAERNLLMWAIVRASSLRCAAGTRS